MISSDALVAGGGLVAVHVKSAEMYTRLWCPFEMNQATTAQVPVHAAASKAYLQDLDKTLRYFVDEICKGDEEKGFEMFAKRKLRPDTASAECSSVEDAQRIRAQALRSPVRSCAIKVLLVR